MDLNLVEAMCYSPAFPDPNASIDYLCPRCGERTSYSLGDSEVGGDGVNLSRWFMEEEIPLLRRRVKAIRALDLELDESSFCRACRQPGAKPELVLIVHHPGEETPHRAPGIEAEDLDLIAQFLSGSDRYTDPHDSESPMKEHIETLERLLGLDR